MRKKTSAILLSILFLVSAPGLVVGDVVKDIAKKAAEAAFSEAERQAIEKYYEVTAPIRGKEYERDDDEDDYTNNKKRSEGKKKDKGEGKNKRKELPKGIAKKLERGGTLPPGMAKRGLPENLEKELPPVPKGYERILSDGQVLLSNIATGVISDIINIGRKSIELKITDKPVVKSSAQKEESQSPDEAEKKWWQLWKD
ncbi:MAG: Ni/Co efflux regulator RcnB [Gammaproteobacteria bacterium]|jgi:Ni/Co efflux regulator RcnB